MKKTQSIILSLVMLINLCAALVVYNVSAAKVETVIDVEADSQVQAGSMSDRNYGASTALQVSDDGVRKSIFRFNTENLPDNIDKAVFKVYCNTSVTREFPLVVGLAADDSWVEGDKKGTVADETELTYDNFPEMAESFEYPFTASKGYIEIDVTTLVQQKLEDNAVSIILSGSNTVSADRNVTFLAKENGENTPQLVISSEYEQKPQSIKIAGEKQIVTNREGITETKYSAEVLDQTGNVLDAEVVWSVYEKDTYDTIDGITVDGGVLYIENIDREYDVDLYAYAAEDEDVYDKISINILPGNKLNTITLSADADANIQGGSAAKNNFGASSNIQIRDDNYRVGFVRFKYQPLPGEVKKAVLRLYCTSSMDKEMPLGVGVADTDSWVEGTKTGSAGEGDEITSLNMPSYTNVVEYPFVPQSGYVEIDVTEIMKQKQTDTAVTFVLNSFSSGNGTMNLYFNSKEASSGHPELDILTQYDPVTSSIEISGEDRIISSDSGKTLDFEYTATVRDQAAQVMSGVDVDWYVYESETQEPVDGVTIKDGILSVGSIDKSCNVDIYAVCSDDENITAKKTVELLKGEDYVTRHITLTAQADTQVQGGSKASTNYGASKTIQLRDDGYRKTLFRFDLSDVYGIVDKAELNVYKSVVTAEDIPLMVALADSDDWIEGDKADQTAENGEICDQNRPSYTDKIPVIMPSGIGYASFDVADFITKKLEQNKMVSIYVLGETVGGATNVTLYAREAGTNMPKLELDMKYIPELTDILISGSDAIVIPNEGMIEENYSVAMGDQYGEPVAAEKPVWTLKDAADGITVDAETGTLVVSDSAKSGTVTLVATSGEVSGEINIVLKTAQEAVDAAYDALVLENADYVTSDLTLLTQGLYNTQIVWESSNEELITSDGKINRPDTDEQYIQAELTATISCQGISRTKTFTVNIVKIASIIEIEAENKGFIHNGGQPRERLIDPYNLRITNSGGRKTVLKFDISELRKYKDYIEKAEVMMVPWMQQAKVNKVELINSAVISDDWDPFRLGSDGLLEIDGINYNDHIKTLKSNVAQGYNTVYNDLRYVAVDMTDEIKKKIENYAGEDPTTVNEGNYSGNKLSVMLYADDVEFESTQQYAYPLLKVTLAYTDKPDDIKIEQDIYYDEKVRVPNEGSEMRQYVASAIDEMGREYPEVDDFVFSLADEYEGVTISDNGKLLVDTAAKEGIITVICKSELSGLEKSFDVEILAPIEEISRPNLLFDIYNFNYITLFSVHKIWEGGSGLICRKVWKFVKIRMTDTENMILMKIN